MNIRLDSTGPAGGRGVLKADDNAWYPQSGSGYANYVVTAAIPEPATATLSLLALAGLAARRRRK